MAEKTSEKNDGKFGGLLEDAKRRSGTKIKLNVGGKQYETSLKTLTSDEDSMLAAMFTVAAVNKDDSYFIDRDGEPFGHIINFLRDGSVPHFFGTGDAAERCKKLQREESPDGHMYRSLVREAQYYKLETLGRVLSGAKVPEGGGRSGQADAKAQRSLRDKRAALLGSSAKKEAEHSAAGAALRPGIAAFAGRVVHAFIDHLNKEKLDGREALFHTANFYVYANAKGARDKLPDTRNVVMRDDEWSKVERQREVAEELRKHLATEYDLEVNGLTPSSVSNSAEFSIRINYSDP